MKLIEIISNPIFKLSVNPTKVKESLCSTIRDITGQYPKCDRNSALWTTVKRLVEKIKKCKKNKQQFIKLEESWLCQVEVTMKHYTAKYYCDRL